MTFALYFEQFKLAWNTLTLNTRETLPASLASVAVLGVHTGPGLSPTLSPESSFPRYPIFLHL